ncbi:hypothetical protein ACFU7T_26215 [Streptomyces sp. NPDC057555]|uniref:hypothetical protein n=1 Tax=Streptomyces sp. NPDC057555 TaxID=3346166 RepID=UPI0036CF52B4
MNTFTNRLRGRSGRRIAAALVAAAALGLGATACGPDSGTAGAPGAPGASASTQPPGAPSSDNSGPQGQNGGQSSAAPSGPAAPGSGTGGGSGTGSHTGSHTGGQTGGHTGGRTGGDSAPVGGGTAQAGNHRTFVGTLGYLAPGKLTVKPQGGGMEQAFYVATDTRILGAAAICSTDDGSVTIGKDGYGNRRCTLDDLEKAAKTNSVTVRLILDRKSGAAETVEEKYHP